MTIAEVAAAAGVSKVTVFSHFERKEDRLPDAVDIVRAAVRRRAADTSPVKALHQVALALAAERHPLSGLSGDVEPFMRTLTASPALTARLHAFGHEIETELAAELHADAGFAGDSALAAALLVAAYRTVAVESARRRLAGGDLADTAATHRERLNEAFDAVAHGLYRAELRPREATACPLDHVMHTKLPLSKPVRYVN